MDSRAVLARVRCARPPTAVGALVETGVEGDRWLASPAELPERIEELRRADGCMTVHCWQIERAEAAIRAQDWGTAVDLLERISRRGGGTLETGVDDLFAMLRLGAAYEGNGQADEAITAYRRIIDMWSDPDEEGQAVVRRFEARVAALSGGRR